MAIASLTAPYPKITPVYLKSKGNTKRIAVTQTNEKVLQEWAQYGMTIDL